MQPLRLMSSVGKSPVWWDREVDACDRPIRSDVRAAAHGLWTHACSRAQSVLGDSAEAASLMEASVAQISRYLDRVAPLESNTHSIGGLLMRAFSRALRRHARKLHRIQLTDDLSELEETASGGRSSVEKQDFRIDAEKAAGRLSERSRMMLDLRSVGFGWKDIAGILETTEGAVRAEFYREVKKVKMKLL